MNTAELNEAVKLEPYDISDMTKEAKFGYVTQRNKRISAMELEWTEWLANEYAYLLPRSVTDLIYSAAWERGHSHGYNEVESCYHDFAELARVAFDAGRNAV